MHEIDCGYRINLLTPFHSGSSTGLSRATESGRQNGFTNIRLPCCAVHRDASDYSGLEIGAVGPHSVCLSQDYRLRTPPRHANPASGRRHLPAYRVTLLSIERWTWSRSRRRWREGGCPI